VKVDPGVTVTAVGNVFDPGVQGAGSAGEYTLGAGPCGAETCDLIAGSGANYRVTSGTLRLASP
jgi:hypothetical protein